MCQSPVRSHDADDSYMPGDRETLTSTRKLEDLFLRHQGYVVVVALEPLTLLALDPRKVVTTGTRASLVSEDRL